MIQEIFGVSFISRSSFCIQVNNLHTLYQYVTERHPKTPKSLASWQEEFFPCGCRRRHCIYREWGMMMEQLLMSGFITLLLRVAASTASPVSHTVVSRRLLPVLLLLLLKHHPYPPSLLPPSLSPSSLPPSFLPPSFLPPLLLCFPLSNPASLKPHSFPFPVILLVTLLSGLTSLCSLLCLSPPLPASQ